MAPPDHFCLSVTLFFNLGVLRPNNAYIWRDSTCSVQLEEKLRQTIGALKMNRLLFTLTVVVLMAAHGEYCTTLELEL